MPHPQGQVAGGRGPGDAVELLLQNLVAGIDVEIELLRVFALEAGYSQEVLRHPVFVLARAAAETRPKMLNTASGTAPIVATGSSIVLGALDHTFSGVDRRLRESVALVDFFQFRNRGNLTNQPPQPGVARGGECAIIRRHRIL